MSYEYSLDILNQEIESLTRHVQTVETYPLELATEFEIISESNKKITELQHIIQIIESIADFKSKQGIPDKYGRTEIEHYLYRIDLEADHSDAEGETEFLRDLYGFILGIYPECNPYQKR